MAGNILDLIKRKKKEEKDKKQLAKRSKKKIHFDKNKFKAFQKAFKGE